MPMLKKPSTKRPPAPGADLGREIPADVIDVDPFFLDMGQGMPRRALAPFALGRTTLRPRASTEILAELSRTAWSPEHAPSRSATPTSGGRPVTPVGGIEEPSPQPSPSAFRTPRSTRTVAHLRVVETETSPASSWPSSSSCSPSPPSSAASKRSVDAEGDVRMRNGTLTSPEAARMRLREEVRGLVAQGVHDNFEFERGRFAEEVRGQVLAAVGEEVERLVRERFGAALAGALGLREEGEEETAVVQMVRERLVRMSDEGRARVFCTREMLEVLRRMADLVEVEMRTEGWSLVEADDEDWIG
ncbi:hypothetical protein CGRA01v4_14896 [Colletotrichum graminicola]|nr:hypothetical protein CGRA01v4_14896 [Colletotrichum graminicola]